jgi:hypothetical protein
VSAEGVPLVGPGQLLQSCLQLTHDVGETLGIGREIMLHTGCFRRAADSAIGPARHLGIGFAVTSSKPAGRSRYCSGNVAVLSAIVMSGCELALTTRRNRLMEYLS